MAEREPFNPEDPFDAMTDTIRRDICEVGLRALNTTLYREMDGQKQIESFVAGALCGLVGVAFSHIHPDSRDYIMEYIKECLPAARQIVDEIEQYNTATKQG